VRVVRVLLEYDASVGKASQVKTAKERIYKTEKSVEKGQN